MASASVASAPGAGAAGALEAVSEAPGAYAGAVSAWDVAAGRFWARFLRSSGSRSCKACISSLWDRRGRGRKFA